MHMHVDTSEGGAVVSRCGFRSVRYLEVSIHCEYALGLRIVSAVRSLECPLREVLLYLPVMVTHSCLHIVVYTIMVS